MIARQQMRELAKLSRMLDTMLDLVDLSDTMVVFTADNGLNYGEHNIHSGGTTKNDHYEVSQRVPLVIAGGDFPHATEDTPCLTLVDVGATLREVTGFTSPLDPAFDGLSLFALVEDGPTVGNFWLNRTVGMYRHFGVLNPNPQKGWACVYDGVKLIRWEKNDPSDPDLPADDVYEMYDLEADPDEHNNLAYIPAHSALLASMLDKLGTFIVAPI
jgi:arylsulfatase A-like enzyme